MIWAPGWTLCPPTATGHGSSAPPSHSGAQPAHSKRLHTGITENSAPEQPLRRDLLEHFPGVFVVGAGAQVLTQVAGGGGAVAFAQGDGGFHLEQPRVTRLGRAQNVERLAGQVGTSALQLEGGMVEATFGIVGPQGEALREGGFGTVPFPAQPEETSGGEMDQRIVRVGAVREVVGSDKRRRVPLEHGKALQLAVRPASSSRRCTNP